MQVCRGSCFLNFGHRSREKHFSISPIAWSVQPKSGNLASDQSWILLETV